jgi:hypothetical protein
MNASDVPRAVEAAVATGSAIGLRVEHATVIHASNRIAVRLLPGDGLARVAYEAHQGPAEFEAEVALRLAKAGGPVGTLDPHAEPRAYLRDGFAVTLWTHYESLPEGIAPTEYARALQRLHVAMRQVDIAAPHYTDRVSEAQSLLDDRALTPDLGDAERRLLSETLQGLTAKIQQRGATEQLLHGEPHPGNLLHTASGPLFIDLETCCRGPVEFDLAHAPEEVREHYPLLDEDLLTECRMLMLAMIVTWRWDRDDQLPNGRQLAREWTAQLRTALDGYRRQ